ncbi:MAG: hypothetical protein AAF605_02280 [Myxococcota bacterium]
MDPIRPLAPRGVAASQPTGSDLEGLVERLNRGDQNTDASLALIQAALKSPALTPVGRVVAAMRLRSLHIQEPPRP